MESKTVSVQTLQRLPVYLNFLEGMQSRGVVNVSATTIAEALSHNDVQVRKDLSLVSSGGRPKTGYDINGLILDIERFLGYDNVNSAVIAGVGNLGRALLSYECFRAYGLDIVAAFDIDENKISTTICHKKILPNGKIKDLCRRMKIKIGIITVPAAAAQSICDDMVEGGVCAIWNLTQTSLKVPDGVFVKNENMACSLAVLSKHLTENLYQ